MGFHALLDLEPYPQPRPRLTSRGGRPRAYEVPRATAWKAAAALLIAQQMRPTRSRPTRIVRFDGPLSVSVTFRMKRGKVPIHQTRADLDNLAKSLLDAATQAGLWGDDRQIVELHLVKEFLGPQPHIILRVYEIGEEVKP